VTISTGEENEVGLLSVGDFCGGGEPHGIGGVYKLMKSLDA